MWQRLAGVGLGLALGGVVFAQEAASPRFEVVSVKRNRSDDVASSLRPDANGVTGINVTPLRLVRVAYQVADFQVADAPGWFTSERYDITARAGEPVSMAQLGPMMQTLLAERFGLRIVQRRRESTVLELQVDPANRVRMTASPRPCALAPADAPAARVAGTPACFSTIAGSMVGRGVTTGMLAQELTRRLERFVIDRSGLTGTFDFDLAWAPDSGGVPAAGDAPLSDLPPLVTAVREQLGLTLVPARAPVDVYVVEAASRPVAN
jgi:uncharacterized protein (TIGR03435 family)